MRWDGREEELVAKVRTSAVKFFSAQGQTEHRNRIKLCLFKELKQKLQES